MRKAACTPVKDRSKLLATSSYEQQLTGYLLLNLRIKLRKDCQIELPDSIETTGYKGCMQEGIHSPLEFKIICTIRCTLGTKGELSKSVTSQSEVI